MANFFRSVLSSARAILQNKTATPTTSVQVITPDSGYDGLAQVTVNAVNLQSKTTTMTPPSPSSWSATTTKLGTVTPDSGYTGLSQADISIPMIPDNTTLSLQSSGTSYDTYTTGRGGYVFSNSYLRVPKSGGGGALVIPLAVTTGTGKGESAGCAQIEFPSDHGWSTVRFSLGSSINDGVIGVRRLSTYSTSANFSYDTDYDISGKSFKITIYANSSQMYGGRWMNVELS